MIALGQKQEIIDALATISGVKKVSESWPEGTNNIPCITIDMAGNRPTDYRDDKPYVREVEFYIRLFAKARADFLKIGLEIERIMEGLGYDQSFQWEEPGAGIRQLAFRYKKVF